MALNNLHISSSSFFIVICFFLSTECNTELLYFDLTFWRGKVQWSGLQMEEVRNPNI